MGRRGYFRCIRAKPHHNGSAVFLYRVCRNLLQFGIEHYSRLIGMGADPHLLYEWPRYINFLFSDRRSDAPYVKHHSGRTVKSEGIIISELPVPGKTHNRHAAFRRGFDGNYVFRAWNDFSGNGFRLRLDCRGGNRLSRDRRLSRRDGNKLSRDRFLFYLFLRACVDAFRRAHVRYVGLRRKVYKQTVVAGLYVVVYAAFKAYFYPGDFIIAFACRAYLYVCYEIITDIHHALHAGYADSRHVYHYPRRVGKLEGRIFQQSVSLHQDGVAEPDDAYERQSTGALFSLLGRGRRFFINCRPLNGASCHKEECRANGEHSR